ncbi:hypothetical protein Enr13x_68310 [Stieleria neptunia]|uniref:Ser-Thr-rich glycosyl-phosphatidyl-inositol-anchored membrane family protein n=2 Tax=Stieleria neptunia TaxID=2527979 RepID=A0A518I1C1_9BACT|nr:hypothetical protein Enr13x_68310 [Stieleria neptunia]
MGALFAIFAVPALAVDPDAIVLTSRVFDIPFQMERDSGATTVRLYVSSDRGQTWDKAAEQPLPIQQFHFEATADGDYWFTHATDLDTPPRPTEKLSPERKIFIDTTGPAIDLQAGADVGGNLSAQLTLTDPHQVATLRVLYATDVGRQWVTVPNASIDQEGRFSIRPADDWQQMSVHVTATDSIGNASVQAKTFRRPRVAATQRPRMAASPNQLRIQTVAGPSDPPSYRLGPTADNPTSPPTTTPTPATTSPPSPASGAALQSPGSGPLRSTGNASPPVRGTAPATTPATGRSLQSFGSAFGPTTRPRTKPIEPAPAGTATTPAPPSPAARLPGTPSRPMTLPASGLTAKLTPEGIEVLPAPQPESAPAEPPPAPATTPAATPETLPTPKPESADAPTLNLAPPKSPGAPITESIPRPKADAKADADGESTPQRSRTLEEALRPITPRSQTTPNRPSPGPAAEPIPTPAPSSTPEDQRRDRAERAEQLSREQQQRYDRAQLARTVPFRWSNSNRFSLEYELEAVGASGTEAVELYGSLDAGRTWKRWGADPDRTSPFDIETKGEGVFAFRIVVLGNNGLASPRPLPGDQPDIAVIVDQTLPKIKITSARYGEGDRTGSLIIRYECSDENLMNRPVAIAFSDSIDGPWTTIAAGLRNDGLYVWPADPKLPHEIYLRVDATDQAGNTGSYLLDQPIATGGLAPRARILGFRSR